MNKITEIIPDTIPKWAQRAIDDGQFFRVAIERVAELELALTETFEQVYDNSHIDALVAHVFRDE
jgi:hypothetical protein